MSTNEEGKPAVSLPAGSYDFQKLREGGKPEDARMDKPMEGVGGIRPDQKLVKVGTEKVRVHDPKSEAAKKAQPLEQSIPDLSETLAKITSTGDLKALRDAEVKGENRSGALAAIDARMSEISTSGAAAPKGKAGE